MRKQLVLTLCWLTFSAMAEETPTKAEPAANSVPESSAPAAAEPSAPSAVETPVQATASSEEIISVFEKAILLNTTAKRSIAQLAPDAKGKQTEVDAYYTKSVKPLAEAWKGLLSSGNDEVLMTKLLELVASFENSPDESLPYDLAEVYRRNPKPLEVCFRKLPQQQREAVAQRLELGWASLMHDKTPSARDRELAKRLKFMKQ